MQNFLKNAKNVFDVAQAASKEISNAYNQQQQKTRRASPTSSPGSRSRSRSNEKEASPFKNIDSRTLTRMDNETCFSVMLDADKFYHVIFVEGGGLSILKTGNQRQAETQRNLLNKHPVVARVAYGRNLLRSFVNEVNTHPDWSSIHISCYLGLEDAAEKICEKDALLTVNLATSDNGSLPLHIAIQQKHLTLAIKLLKIGADLRKCDLNTNNCLHYAIPHGFVFVKGLHDAKPDQFKDALNCSNNDDFTPFHFALKTESPQLIHYLIEVGADTCLIGVEIQELGATISALNTVLKKDPNSLTGKPIKPYHTIFHGEFDRKYLKCAHFWNPKIVDHPNDDQRTPLHCAVARNDLERVVDLLSFGANVHLVGKRGNTPLHLAVSKGNEAMVKILLCFDSDYNRKNKDGKSAIELQTTAAVAQLFAQLFKCKKTSEVTDAGSDLPDLIKMKQDKSVEYQEDQEPEVRQKSLRLLSLDGGGIRGLCMTIMLMRIERETKSKRIVDYFDWIAGTSTGSIFALSLLEGYSTAECLQFYLRLKDDVFIGNRPHDTAPLEAFLKQCFGEKTMDQAKKRIVVTTTKSDVNPPKLVLIRSYDMPELITLSIPPKEIKMWKAARCSSAAPTYFSSVDKMYLDGGLIANNPTPDLLSDVQYYNLFQESQGKETLPIACMLSLGTGRLPDQPIEGIDLEVSKTSGLGSLFSNMTATLMTLKNLKNIFMEQLATSDGAVVERSRTWAHSLDIPYYRYTPQLTAECLLNTHDNLEVIELMWTSKLYAESRSQSEIQQIIRLLRAN